MNIKAVNSVMHGADCQPIRTQMNNKSASPAFKMNETDYNDSFSYSDPVIQEQKYDFACRLAASNAQERDFYRAKYEALKQRFDCCA